MSKKALAYARVSTEEQHTTSDQIERIKKYCKFKDFHLVDVLQEEGVSGGDNDFNLIISRLKENGVNALVVDDLDRLSRDMLRMLLFEAWLREVGVELHTISGKVDTSEPQGFLNFGMKVFLSEWERRQIKSRTKKALQTKKANGEVAGKVRYGYKRRGNKIIRNMREQEIKKLVNSLYQEGLNISEIAKELNQQGYRTRAKTRFQAVQIKNMLENYQNVYKKDYSKKAKKVEKALSTLF